MGQVLRKVEEYEDESQIYINAIHGKSKGWITKAEINEGVFRQWHYKLNQLLDIDFTQENTYISLNTFYKTYRRIENLKEINCIHMDLDTYKTKFTKTQILMNLDDNYFGKTIPIPNLIIDSGRGLYLIWLIEPVPYMALPLWKAIEEYIYKELKEFGADRMALDPTRVLRVPGSINSKSNTIVKILETNEYVYKLREIQEEYLPEIPKKEKGKATAPKKRGRPKKVVYVFNERSLYLARITDLVKLCELRSYDIEGEREMILFLYRYYLNYFFEDENKALNDTLELNRMFDKPLTEKEATKATESAERAYKSKNKDYKYKNETLIELLQITEEEQKHMITIISKNEYKARHRAREKNRYASKLKEQGKMTKQEELKLLREKIKVLRGQGLRNQEISNELNIPLKTLKRHITYMKKNGLLA
ncbi:DNA-binding response regulator [Paeniclostridium sp. NSJ-45]|uniref:DNA-binding response regulator n=1 Tax=Paeniclostridium hominis TaxID=2764329 RepID=A0ABR7K7H5_9FIRM|nr:DNA-binding response regulator [Paeniclostridium hominis]MBC6005038.1 DNA-binding response regulator [Paeniclostridium hominis]